MIQESLSPFVQVIMPVCLRFNLLNFAMVGLYNVACGITDMLSIRGNFYF